MVVAVARGVCGLRINHRHMHAHKPRGLTIPSKLCQRCLRVCAAAAVASAVAAAAPHPGLHVAAARRPLARVTTAAKQHARLAHLRGGSSSSSQMGRQGGEVGCYWQKPQGETHIQPASQPARLTAVVRLPHLCDAPIDQPLALDEARQAPHQARGRLQAALEGRGHDHVHPVPRQPRCRLGCLQQQPLQSNE